MSLDAFHWDHREGIGFQDGTIEFPDEITASGAESYADEHRKEIALDAELVFTIFCGNIGGQVNHIKAGCQVAGENFILSR